jgi:hypothetical protein
MFYLIENNIVKEIHAENFPIAESAILKWKESSETIKLGQIYDSENDVFLPDPKRNLDSIKSQKKNFLKNIRNNSFVSTITHAKGEFSASEGAYTKLSAIVAAWNGSTSELWRDVENNMVSLTKTECKEILRAIKDAHTPIYAKEALVATQIHEETDLELLESFDVQAAWDAA